MAHEEFRSVSKTLIVPAPVDVVLALLTDLGTPAASRARLTAFEADTTTMGPGTRVAEVRGHRGRTVRRSLVIDSVVPEGYLASGHIGTLRCRMALRARPVAGGSTRLMSDLHLQGHDEPPAVRTRLVPGPLRAEHVFLALVGRDLVVLARSAIAVVAGDLPPTPSPS